jgi:hypothetical protein
VLRTPINAVSLVPVFVKKELVAPRITLKLIQVVALHVPQAVIKRPIQMLYVPRAVPIHLLVVVEIPMARALQAKLEILDLVQHVVLVNTRMSRALPNVVMLMVGSTRRLLSQFLQMKKHGVVSPHRQLT